MEKIIRYQSIICDLLQEYASIKKSLTPQVKAQSLADRENHHYQLLSVGWHNQQFVYTVALHFDIVEDKVWIQQNNTDALIADELIERGIERGDIVLGFVPEKAHSFSGYATA